MCIAEYAIHTHTYAYTYAYKYVYIHIHICLYAVHLKLTQHCKSTIL